ncbi:hypothetical protein EYC80_002334 [Monilinia laxa]|uniref:Uncharacterized protein n=1 Tax=Monilinia laxa TaxID=61186 RepID=A0A5N6K3K4_MONLA|nr:hypothetical protein EYC80_002334 [Monilinia laxa]
MRKKQGPVTEFKRVFLKLFGQVKVRFGFEVWRDIEKEFFLRLSMVGEDEAVQISIILEIHKRKEEQQVKA